MQKMRAVFAPNGGWDGPGVGCLGGGRGCPGTELPLVLAALEEVVVVASVAPEFAVM